MNQKLYGRSRPSSLNSSKRSSNSSRKNSINPSYHNLNLNHNRSRPTPPNKKSNSLPPKKNIPAYKKDKNNIFAPTLNRGYPFQPPNKRNINQANNRKFSPFEKRMNTNSNIQKAKLNKSIHYEEMQIQTIYLFQN